MFRGGMTAELMHEALRLLNYKLMSKGLMGEIAIYGGAVMCLVLNVREQTIDIDAIFEPKMEILKIVSEVAYELGLPDYWLNDGVKGYLSSYNNISEVKRMSNLVIYAPQLDYLLAMKMLASRVDHAYEVEDIKYLLRVLNVRTVEVAIGILYSYYPSGIIPQRTYYLIEELLEEVWGCV